MLHEVVKAEYEALKLSLGFNERMSCIVGN